MDAGHEEVGPFYSIRQVIQRRFSMSDHSSNSGDRKTCGDTDRLCDLDDDRSYENEDAA